MTYDQSPMTNHQWPNLISISILNLTRAWLQRSPFLFNMFLTSLNRCFNPRLCLRWIFGRMSNFGRKWHKTILITISRTSINICIYTIINTSNSIKTCINILIHITSIICAGWRHSWWSLWSLWQSATSRSAPVPVIHSVSKPINLIL